MSKFKTTIPVDVAAVKKLLPAGAFFDGVSFDDETNSVEVRWQHDPFKTPFDHAIEFPIEHLQAGEVPSFVKAEKRVPAVASPVEPSAEAEPTSESTPSEAAVEDVPTAGAKTVAKKSGRK